MEKLYTISELSSAREFPYKSASIRRFIKEGRLKTVRYSSQKIMITESAIKEFLNTMLNGGK